MTVLFLFPLFFSSFKSSIYLIAWTTTLSFTNLDFFTPQNLSIELIASANLILTTLSCNLLECCFNSFLITGTTVSIYSFNELTLETLLIYALNKDFCG